MKSEPFEDKVNWNYLVDPFPDQHTIDETKRLLLDQSCVNCRNVVKPITKTGVIYCIKQQNTVSPDNWCNKFEED